MSKQLSVKILVPYFEKSTALSLIQKILHQILKKDERGIPH